MHDIRAIRANPDDLKSALAKRNADPSIVDGLISLDEARRAAITQSETLLARRNAASKEIGAAMGRKDMAAADALKAEVSTIKDQLAGLEANAAALDSELKDKLAAIPNIPKPDVPVGVDEHGNVEYRRQGAKPVLDFAPKEHFELGEALGMMDFETAAKLSGSRFVVLQKGLARLERALGQFMLDQHTEEFGYTEVNPPILVKDDAMFGTAQLPKFRDDQFGTMNDVFLKNQVRDKLSEKYEEFHKVASQNLGKLPAPEGIEIWKKRIQALIDDYADKEFSVGHWLIPTAEVPLTNLVRESILNEDQLPLRFTALTPCFRAEAGSAGRDTRGMLRQHQFNKVELVSITTPEQSADEHERMLAAAENILTKLGLHYRVMTLCTGDMGFGSQKTYDIEVWLPGQNSYREISSCSVCGDFQAMRMNARYRPSSEKGTRFVHTLNGSGVAVGRCLIAVMENYQNADGSINVPEVLQPYMRGARKIG